MQQPRHIRSPYGGYFQKALPKEDAELTHVGPGTPGGEYLRRFWHPVALTSDLGELPLRIRILGEDLVLFRDGSQRIGLLHLHCSHRGTSLEFGRIEEGGIRCCYHGWLYGIDGKILQTPGEPPDNRLKDTICHGAYPTHEYQGLIFAYFGPPDRKPPFPMLDTFSIPGDRLVPRQKLLYPCNWVQIKENNMDPIHVYFLHSTLSGVQFTNAFATFPEIDFIETPTGMVCVATRQIENRVWFRVNDCVMPNVHQSPPQWHEGEKSGIGPMVTNWTVPIDDTNSMIIGWMHFYEAEKDHIVRLYGPKGDLPTFGTTGDRPYEERQRAPGDYDAQVSQRPIAIHALEHLATGDRGVAMFRRLIRVGIQDVASGVDPKGVVRDGRTPIRTVCQDKIVERESTASIDRADLKTLARNFVEAELKNPRPVHERQQ